MTTQPAGPAPDDLTCQQLVEAVTDYLEGALTAADRARFERHLEECPPCNDYVDQIQRTISLSGGIAAEDLAPAARARLVELFRGWKNA